MSVGGAISTGSSADLDPSLVELITQNEDGKWPKIETKICQLSYKYPKQAYGASGATAGNGTLIICGGYSIDYETNVKHYSSECFKLNLNQDPNWTKLGDMSTQRSVCLFILSHPKSLLQT